MSVLDDILYYGETEEQRKRRKLAEARRKGKAGEESYRFWATLQGKQVERTGHGHDFKETTRDLLTGRVISERYVEVKSGPKAKLSELQEKEKKKKKGRYAVVRENPIIY